MVFCRLHPCAMDVCNGVTNKGVTLQEAGKTKCHMYWPRQPGPQNKVRYGDVRICSTINIFTDFTV